LNEFSTCRSELKKLAKILVGSNPDLFPSCEDQADALQNKPAHEIRIIAARLDKKRTKSEKPLYDSEHVRTSVIACLGQFEYLNCPPTITVSPNDTLHNVHLILRQGDLLANPILESLCKSFYEEEKWQRSLLLHTDGEDNEWMSSVPITMVALAATAVS
jgi:hypothetical protein